MMPNFLPGADPIALPAPAALLRLLLIATLALHMLLLSLTIGGGLIAFFAGICGRRFKNPHAQAFSRKFSAALPVILAFAITLGVAPLLFVQVLYGQFFYSATILMAWPWLSVVLAMIVAYYLLYARAFGKVGAGAGLLALGLLAWVAFLYVNESTLSMTPKKWWTIWSASQSGLHLNLAEPTLLPRFSHLLVGMVAVAGIGIAAYGALQQKTDPKYGRWVKAHGALWFAGATLLQLAAGLWLLLSLPRKIGQQFLGADVGHTAHLFAAAGVAVLALLLAAGVRKRAARAPIVVCAILIALVVAAMVVVREWVREAYLADYLAPANVEVQTSAVILFFALFAIGLAVIAWMLVKTARRGRA
jgi:hypothetical protein